LKRINYVKKTGNNHCFDFNSRFFILTKSKFIGEVPKVIEPEKKENGEMGDKKIRLISTSCTDGKLTFKIINDGNVEINKSDLRVFINDEEKTDNFIDKGINPGDVTSYSDSITTYSGKQNIRLEGPDNTIGWGITC